MGLIEEMQQLLREAKGKGLQVFAKSPGTEVDDSNVYAWLSGKKPLPDLPAQKKWDSAGCVILPSLEGKDLGYVYVIKPTNNYGPWAFPKGRVDANETPQQAAIREVAEETGLTVKLLPGGYLGKAAGRYSNTHFFMAVQTGGSPTQHDKEVEVVRLVTFSEAFKLFTHAGNKRDAMILRDAWRYVRKKLAKEQIPAGVGLDK